MAHEHHDHHHHHHGTPEGLDADAVAECPVMGTQVVKQEAEAAGLAREYGGKRYWLCCNSCAEQWDANPAAFAV